MSAWAHAFRLFNRRHRREASAPEVVFGRTVAFPIRQYGEVAVGCVLATPDRCAYAFTRPKVGSYLPKVEPGEDGRRRRKRATSPLRCADCGLYLQDAGGGSRG